MQQKMVHGEMARGIKPLAQHLVLNIFDPPCRLEEAVGSEGASVGSQDQWSSVVPGTCWIGAEHTYP